MGRPAAALGGAPREELLTPPPTFQEAQPGLSPLAGGLAAHTRKTHSPSITILQTSALFFPFSVCPFLFLFSPLSLEVPATMSGCGIQSRNCLASGNFRSLPVFRRSLRRECSPN